MPHDHATSLATGYWASWLGCSTEALFADPCHVITHGIELADYDGIFALFRRGAATISCPAASVQRLRHELPPAPTTPDRFASALQSQGKVIGPAYIGYAEAITPTPGSARPLARSDAAAIERLQAACTNTEWDHGGGSVEDDPASGVFVGEQLVARASYQIWGETIAHVSIVTHPDFRGRGVGRQAVAHVSALAVARGLLPQYRTLEANRPSMRIADALGFVHYASSVAVRLR